MKIAGSRQADVFNDEAVASIFENSGGIPRRINQICDMCLLSAFNNEVTRIDKQIAEDVVASLGV